MPVRSQQEARDSKRPIRILLADDSETIRTVAGDALVAAGYDVVAAEDGEDAWTKLCVDGAEVPFDLVVSDVEMPGLDGLALTERIRASERFAGLPVILVTSLASEEDRELGRESGASAYLVKNPVDQTELLAQIRELV